MIAQSLARLSSGSRLAAGTTDPAALSSSVHLETESRAIKQVSQSTRLGASLLQTALSAIQSQLEITQRMRELALQANSTLLNAESREILNEEFQELIAELDRITNTTNFNGRPLIDGTQPEFSLLLSSQSASETVFSLPDLRGSEIFQTTRSLEEFETNQQIGTPSGAEGDIAAGDLNGDGLDDLVYFSRSGGPRIQVFLSNGNGTFTETGISETAGVRSLELVDVNNDGNLDILAETFGGSTNIFVRLGDGQGGFGAKINSDTTIGSLTGVTYGDLNGDGNIDAVANNGSATSILFGDGTGSFTLSQTIGLGNATRVGDLNRDGHQDLVIALNSWTNHIYLNNGNGEFTFLTSFSDGTNNSTIALADLNEDGILDLIAQNSYNLGNGDGTFQSYVNAFNAGYDLTIADLNNDGLDDILSATNGGVRFYWGRDSAISSSSVFLANGDGNTWRVTAGDFDGDGFLDIASGPNGPAAGDIHVYLQKTETISALPSMNLLSAESASNTLEIIDEGRVTLLDSLSSLSSQLNRLEFAANQQELQQENLQSALSLTKDVDLAVETAELIRLQILEQAQVASLAYRQINLGLVLELLR
jgi:flagellin-like hook-associated protein FlgL